MPDFDALDTRVERVAAKVRGRTMQVGASLSEAEVSTFEVKYGISLPDAYRQFLLRVGNDAPGPPSYGLIPLAEPTASRGDHRSHTKDELATLNSVFPFTKPWI
jgi:hypothetical protein